MSTLSIPCPVREAYAPETAGPSWWARLARAVADECRVRRAMTEMRTLDGRALRDLGLDRAGIEHAVRFGRDHCRPERRVRAALPSREAAMTDIARTAGEGGSTMATAARRAMVGAVLLTAAAGGHITPCAAQADGGGAQLTLDERFALVAKRVPEFGGAYLGKDQRTLWVYVTAQRPGMVAELRRALRQPLPGVEVPATIRLRKGDFTFDQLKRWKDSARGVLATPGVTMTDIDDATNRLTIGVSTQQPRSRVVQELGAREIPPAA